jgi:hypothetical protein
MDTGSTASLKSGLDELAQLVDVTTGDNAAGNQPTESFQVINDTQNIRQMAHEVIYNLSGKASKSAFNGQ